MNMFRAHLFRARPQPWPFLSPRCTSNEGPWRRVPAPVDTRRQGVPRSETGVSAL